MSVSVIIPYFNAESTLERAVRSVLIQDECGEIILVNDSSTDRSPYIADQLASKSPLIKVFHHKENLGPSFSRNLGLDQARQDYVAFLDADDEYLPNRFTETLRLFNTQPNIGAIYGSVSNSFLSSELEKKYEHIFSSEISDIYLNPDQKRTPFERLALSRFGSIHLNALTIKRDILKGIRFDQNLTIIQDTDFILTLAKQTELIGLSRYPPLAIRYVHGRNIIFNRDILKEDRIAFLQKWFKLSVKGRHSRDVILHFLRGYLGEHPYSGAGKYPVVKTILRKSILFIKLMISIR